MKKEFRIKKSLEIEKIMTSKIIAKSKHFIVFIKENKEAKHFRFALSISKKNGNAVERNYEKRVIRSIIRSLKDNLYPLDIFLIIRKDIRPLSFKEKETEIYSLLIKIKAIRERNI